MRKKLIVLSLLVSRCSEFKVPIFAVLLFFGALIWAKSDDPFVRKWFKVRTAHRKVECVAVVPKPVRPCPVVFYLHSSGGTLMTDGKELRQLAELGMAAVSLEYDQTNYAAFEEEFSALLEHVHRQPWALSTDASALASEVWVGFSLGAQNELKYLLNHPEAKPCLLVRLGGGWVPEPQGEADFQSLKFKTPTLLIHGERDEVFPVSDAWKLAELLAMNGIPVGLKTLPGLGHTFEPDRAMIVRETGEYIKSHLTPQHPQPEFPRSRTIPFLICTMPAFLCLGGWLYFRREKSTQKIPLTKWEIGLRVVACILAAWATMETAIHLIPPRLVVSTRTLQIARAKLLAPKWRGDFEVLANQSLSSNSIWKNQKLGTLLTHVELAHYCVYELVNWKLPADIYRDYVLSPVIAPDSDAELAWRRPLWEFYYPRIRKENTTTAAAQIIARTLRERVAIWHENDSAQSPRQWPRGIQTIWDNQITDEVGFDRLYVAALRACGVPARLDASGKAEYWDDRQWHTAPRPLNIFGEKERNPSLAVLPSTYSTLAIMRD